MLAQSHTSRKIVDRHFYLKILALVQASFTNATQREWLDKTLGQWLKTSLASLQNLVLKAVIFLFLAEMNRYFEGRSRFKFPYFRANAGESSVTRC
jgi:hypothetical protein